uniref:DUF4412 domain-containing protein n=1 Tax=Eiseniibacteriota bacterium TaxID=2212470 RepID=A0A832I3Y0_UNCEI
MRRSPRPTRRRALAWTALLAALLAAPAAADVHITHRTTSEGLGGFGDGTTVSTQWIAADRARSEDTFTYTGRFKTLVGKKPQTSVSITRLDRELVWTLEPEKKRYTELTFEQMRALMRGGMAEAEAQMAAAGDQGAPQDADMEFTVDVKKTGARADVNGFPCEQVVVTCMARPKGPQPGEAGREFKMIMDQWLTPNLPGQAEIEAFYRAMAARLGVEEELRRLGPMAQRMYGNALRAMGEKLKDVKGHPVRSTFTIEGPPPSAQDRGDAQARARAVEDAEQDRQRAERAADVQDAASAGSAAARGSGSGVAGAVGGFLGRKLAGAAARKATDKAKGQQDAAGGPLFKSVTELVSVSSGAAPAGAFEVPAGFKLVKGDGR